MTVNTANPIDSGLEVSDCSNDAEFAGRSFHNRNVAMQMEGMQRLGHAFIEYPDTILHELVKTAVEVCGADSAGISIERQDQNDEGYYQWVATAGVYSGFANAILPRYPSACGICLERGQPQHFRVGQQFFDLIGVEAAVVTDGILLPWKADETRGTIFIMAHGRTNAFDGDDLRMMQVLANFAAMGIRQQRLQKTLMEQARLAAAAAMANDLAHQINNPLQSVTNLLYVAEAGFDFADAKALSQDLREPVGRLKSLVQELLALPIQANQSAWNEMGTV